MIPDELRPLITQQLFKHTGFNNWVISGPEIEARECIIYKAYNPAYPHDIAIKTYRQARNTDYISQYDTLERFAISFNSNDNEFHAPKLFGDIPEYHTFLMEWIESPTLQWRLWRHCYNKKKIQKDIRRTFQWLREFHSFTNPEQNLIKIDHYKNTLHQYLKNHDGKSSLIKNKVFQEGMECFKQLSEYYENFSTDHAKLHGDFTPSNILIDDEKITGIDFLGQHQSPVVNDICLQLTYIAIEYPNMLNRFDFKHPPSHWPLLNIVLEAYDFTEDRKQRNFLLFVFLYQLLRRWSVIKFRNKNKRTSMLDLWRLRNTEMIVDRLCRTLKVIHNL